ncbi:MAG: NADH-quinone oxidoreductase subunit C [Helicobacteraceae bacterium]|nr:NADH-quinone oxidoreductase subunit C [Helicobacteraceae bacterium]
MEKIETTREKVVNDIEAFYDPNVWRLITINTLQIGDRLEAQWIFAKVGVLAKTRIVFAMFEMDESIPSIRDICPTAIFAEAEQLDLMGARFEGAAEGQFLERDAARMPLRKSTKETDDRNN